VKTAATVVLRAVLRVEAGTPLFTATPAASTKTVAGQAAASGDLLGAVFVGMRRKKLTRVVREVVKLKLTTATQVLHEVVRIEGADPFTTRKVLRKTVTGPG
jgi:hypothetical protein